MTQTLTLKLTSKMEPFLTKKKRIKVAFGGRGGTKSQTVAELIAQKAQNDQAKVGCFREFQNTIEDSVHSLISKVIKKIGIPGYVIQKTFIDHVSGGKIRFRGLAKNPGGVKSSDGFDLFVVEEGQFLSEESLKMLIPTLRETGSELWILLNPGSREDPVSKRYIVPYYKELLANGVYEDDRHYIVWLNYDENPWFPDELEQDRQDDFKNLTRAAYDHIWRGHFNDQVENGLIMAEWFDACIDAHKILGFEPEGIEVMSHDPSDTGPDDKGLVYRHGSVIKEAKRKTDGDINDGFKWSMGEANAVKADLYVWDGEGMGVGGNELAARAFKDKKTDYIMFNSSDGPDDPEAAYTGPTGLDLGAFDKKKQKTNRDAFFNKRAQFAVRYRDRIYNTYRAVIHKEYKDPDTLISFDSGMECLDLLRSESCRMPIKPNSNGKIQLYDKKTLWSKFKIASPNLFDSAFMSLVTPDTTARKSSIMDDMTFDTIF